MRGRVGEGRTAGLVSDGVSDYLSAVTNGELEVEYRSRHLETLGRWNALHPVTRIDGTLSRYPPSFGPTRASNGGFRNAPPPFPDPGQIEPPSSTTSFFAH